MPIPRAARRTRSSASRWLRHTNPIVTTSFGQQSAVLLHLLAEHGPDIPVVWIDTTFNTRATAEFANELTSRLTLNLKKIPPRAGLDSRRAGTDRPGSRRVHPPGKTRPLARALDELQPDMWFSSLRRSQTAHRTTLHHFNPSSGNLLKACPLIDWSEADMDAYRHDHNLPGGHDYHDPTKAGPRRECGLHLQF